jgi:nucleotide-binding universal stress UspA family protein
MPHPIIAGVARSDEAGNATALAVALARVEGAPLILAGVYVDMTGPGRKGYGDAMEPAVRDELAAAAEGVPADVPLRTRAVGATSVVRGLHELAEAEDAAMLVLGPRHTSRFARALRTTIALGALHGSPCPVAVAPPGFAARGRLSARTVGVAYHDTPEARDALAAAVDLAHRLGADLRIIHVIGDPLAAAPELEHGEFPVSDLERVREQAEARLEEARALAAELVHAHTELRHGATAAELVRAAADLDLLVLGSRGFGAFRRVLVGSVAAGVIDEAPCPVLVVPRGAHVHLDAGVTA